MIAQLIRQAAKDCLTEEIRMGALFGEVTSMNPLTVQVEQKLILQEPRLVLPIELQKHTVTVTFGQETQEIVIHPGLQTGDRVILIRTAEYFVVAGRLAAGS